MSEPILFYGRSKPAFFCSNFYPASFVLDGRRWPTSEHYFQAMKFEDIDLQEEVRGQYGPMNAALMGRRKDLPCRRDWLSVRDGVMKKALVAKFTQNEDIREELLATGEAKLVEDSPTDFYWGWGRDRSGVNRLGQLLMEVRAELQLTSGREF